MTVYPISFSMCLLRIIHLTKLAVIPQHCLYSVAGLGFFQNEESILVCALPCVLRYSMFRFPWATLVWAGRCGRMHLPRAFFWKRALGSASNAVRFMKQSCQ